MIIAVTVINLTILVIVLGCLASHKDIKEKVDALVYAQQQELDDMQLFYMYIQYFLSSTRINLDVIHKQCNDRLRKCISDENYEEAKYLQDLCNAISALKQMEQKDIEQYEE